MRARVREIAGDGGGALNPRCYFSVGGDDGAMEGGPGVERAELRTRTPFVVRYLYVPVLGRATRHGRCEKEGKG